MTGLLRSEILRIRSRRLVWGLAILAVVGILVGATIVAVKSRPPSAAQLAEARAEYEQAHDSCLAGEFGVPTEALGGLTLRQWCDRNVRPEQFGTGERFWTGDLPNVLRGTAFIMIVLGLVIGASSIGAEWHARTIATLLTWEPRRTRVLLVRGIVVAATVFVLTVALQAVLGSALWLVAWWRGTTTGAGGLLLQHVAGVLLRVALVGALTAVIGAAIATIGRNTAAALGAVFVYLAVVERLLLAFAPRLTPWLLAPNIVVFVDGHAQSIVPSVLIGVAHALMVTAAYPAVLALAAALAFRTRDIG